MREAGPLLGRRARRTRLPAHGHYETWRVESGPGTGMFFDWLLWCSREREHSPQKTASLKPVAPHANEVSRLLEREPTSRLASSPRLLSFARRHLELPHRTHQPRTQVESGPGQQIRQG